MKRVLDRVAVRPVAATATNPEWLREQLVAALDEIDRLTGTRSK